MEFTFRFIIESTDTKVDLIQRTDNEMVFKVTSTTSKKRKKLNHKLIIDLWNQGVHVNEIAEKVGTTPGSIYQFVHRNEDCHRRRSGKKESVATSQPYVTTKEPTNVASKAEYPRTGEHLRQNEINALCKMWRDGQRNVADLARYFKVSKSTIYYQLRANGCSSKK